MSGKVAPETEKPVPVRVAAFTVTAEVPVELSVIDCAVAAVFTEILPKETALELMLRVGTAAFSWRVKLSDTLPALALTVVDWVVVTAVAVAGKVAVVAPAATVTDAGTVTEVLPLERLTPKPPVAAAAFRATVQVSVAAPVTEALAQVRPVSATLDAVPVPLRETVADVPFKPLLLLVIVSSPEAAPATVGSNFTLNTVVCPGFRVTGKVAPDTV